MPSTTTPSASKAQSQSQQQIKKPARPRRKAITVVDIPSPMQLTDLEIRVALAFRKFRPDLQKEWAETIERVGENYQKEMAAARPVPVLRLVVGGAQ